MIIGDTHASCRYWGYAPVKPDSLSTGDWEQRSAARAEYKATREKVKAAGFKPERSGMRAKIAAIGQASKIEKATGVEMEVFNHDYL